MISIQVESVLLGMTDFSRIAQALSELRNNNQLKLEHGAKQRKEMHLALQEGREPTGYRYEWYRKSTNDIIKVTSLMAEDFNKAHPGDRISVDDLIDVLEAAIRMLDSVD
jgi:endonuclease III-like uncharacterized protein